MKPRFSLLLIPCTLALITLFTLINFLAPKKVQAEVGASTDEVADASSSTGELQAGPLLFDPFPWFSNDNDNTLSVAWGDVDGDGDLDLASGNSGPLGAPNKVYLNVGNELEEAAYWISEDSDKTNSVAWGDMNGDGLLDLAAGNDGAPNRVYLNQGESLETIASWTAPVTEKTYSVAWGDVDGDGDLDLAVGNLGKDKVYLNIGGVLSTTDPWISEDSDVTRSVAWGDIEGDGDLDLAVGNAGAPNKVYLNVAGELSATPVWTAGSTETTRSIAWGDVNGDGLLDLAVGNLVNPFVGAKDKVYLNVGGVLEKNASWISDDPDITQSIAWGDVDGDGDLDLVVGNFNESNKVYLNQGESLETTASWKFSDSDETRSVAWGDVDGDGDLDLAVGNEGAHESGDDDPNKVYFNVVGQLEMIPSWTSITETKHTVVSIAWGDVDGDGDLDLATGNLVSPTMGAPNHLYLNVGTGLEKVASWTSAESDSTRSVAWGDVDGDGDLDLAAGDGCTDKCSENKLYMNTNGILETTAIIFSNDKDDTRSVAWGDVDGDGDLDLAVGNYLSPNKVYRNVEGVLSASASWISDDSDETRSVAWGDVDSDGDLDLVAGNNGPEKVYLNAGGVLATTASWSSEDEDTTLSVAWGDVDGDGDLDLAAGNAGHPDKVYLNVDGVLETTASWNSGSSDGTRSVAWGDVDGDGDLDLATGNMPEANKVYLNRDGALEKPASWVSEVTSSGTMAVAWGDVDGDGDPDLAAGNFNGLSQIYFNERPASLPFPHLPPPGLIIHTNSEPVKTFFGLTTTALAPANFFSLAAIRTDGTIPVTYTVSHPGLQLMREVTAAYSLNGGDHWFPAQPVSGTLVNDLASGYHVEDTVPVAIPDNGTISSAVNFSVSDQLVHQLELNLTISHTTNSQLSAALYSPWPAPTGTKILLFDGVGGTGDGFVHLTLSDQATRSITETIAFTTPVYGLYRPIEPLAKLAGIPLDAPFTLILTDTVSGEAGLLVEWGLNSIGSTHVFKWDVFNSGFFGASDNVVFRLEALPDLVGQPNHTPGPYQIPSYTSQTYPFRVRGTQVRVFSETIADPNAVANALVYRLPLGKESGALPIANSAGVPFQTNDQGYLQGYGQIYPGDTLFALLPVVVTDMSVVTDTYFLYNTNLTPILTGTVDGFTIIPLGLQNITVTAQHPLILFNLDVSLEWDARNDAAYLAQLQADLRSTSETIFDWTNGQAALGQITIYHAREHWNDAHIRIYATNRMRPLASQGGVITGTLTETVILSATEVITYEAGQVHMPATWNRYGDTGGNLAEDWPRTLAHELGHYILYLEDNYLGLNDEQLVSVTTCPSAMADQYSDDDDSGYDEFHPLTDWLSGCEDTLSNRETGRADWETIIRFYTWLYPPDVNVFPDDNFFGPNGLPLAVTQISFVEPDPPPTTLPSPAIYLLEEGGSYLPSSRTSAFLFVDDQLYDLGGPIIDRVHARGASPGDRLCVFDPGQFHLGCQRMTATDEQLTMYSLPAWQPDVTVTPVDSVTLQIQLVASGIDPSLPVYARLYPLTESSLPTVTLSSTLMTDVYTGVFTLTYPTPAGAVHVWVGENTESRREIVTMYSLGGDPGFKRGSGGFKRGSGGFKRGSGAWVLSTDGQAGLFGTGIDSFAEGEFYNLQTAGALPDVPSWATVVGQAYRITTSEKADLENVWLTLGFLKREVPGEISWLKIYYYNEHAEDPSWQALDTDLDTSFNTATALIPQGPDQGPGVYVLMSTSLAGPGWTTFAYSLPNSLPVAEALDSLAESYTTVCQHDSGNVTDPWKCFGAGAPDWANDLKMLTPGSNPIYWIYLTQSVTLDFGGESISLHTPSTLESDFLIPPAIYYGVIGDLGGSPPTPGMTVLAQVNGVACGQTLTFQVESKVVYVIYVAAEDFGSHAGCGTPVSPIVFQVGAFSTSALWDHTKMHDMPIGIIRLFLPVISR